MRILLYCIQAIFRDVRDLKISAAASIIAQTTDRLLIAYRMYECI